MSLTKAGTIVRIDSRKGATMNLNLSDWDWLNAALGVLFLYRGIRDLYNGTGTGWSSEDEKKHFRKFYGIASILCGITATRSTAPSGRKRTACFTCSTASPF